MYPSLTSTPITGIYDSPNGPRPFSVDPSQFRQVDRLPAGPCIYSYSGVHKTVGIDERVLYDGSAANGRTRQLHHLSELRRGVHGNAILQNAYNKHGEDSFVWWVREECEKENLLEREQANCDYDRSLYGKNVLINIVDVVDRPQLGRPRSEETKRKLRDFNKGKTLTEEHRDKISKAHKGKTVSTHTRKKMSEVFKGRKLKESVKRERSASRAAKRSFWVFHPKHGIQYFEVAYDFRLKWGLSRSNISRLLLGRTIICKGWRLATQEEIEAVKR